MYQSIVEYIVNADMYYRMWMVADMQEQQRNGPLTDRSVYTRDVWMPELVDLFPDVRLVPEQISVINGSHILDTQMRFHACNKHPTVRFDSMEIMWGKRDGTPFRAEGPCRVHLTNVKMWHHQNVNHRRRGDAVICDQANFLWNTNSNPTKTSLLAHRTNGPSQVSISNFHVEFKNGKPVADDHGVDIGVNWAFESGIRVAPTRIDKVIRKNEINIDYLNAINAFGDVQDEFIFWDELDRELRAT